MNHEKIKKILEAAVRAPSGDNVQPWSFQVSKNFTRIDLYNQPDKDDSYYNYKQMASFISHGAVIENIMIASRYVGCAPEVKLFPDANQENLVAQINLFPAEVSDEPLYTQIFKRQTNRFQFKRQHVTKEMIHKLEESVNDFDNINIKLVYQDDKVKEIAKVLMVNDRLVFERKDIHDFLFNKIRWNKEEIEKTRDGMPVEVMGLNPLERKVFPSLRHWAIVKFMNYFGLSRIIGLKCWWNCRNSSLLGIISTPGTDKFSFVQGGRAMQRFWLQVTSEGLAFQPIIGLTLLINRLKLNKLLGLSGKHESWVRNAAKLLPDQFGIDESETLIMGFRAGQAKDVTMKTKRKEIVF